MLNPRKVQNFQRHGSLPYRDNDDIAEGSADDSSPPSRYHNGRGGIDLERVRLDQHEARRQIIQAIIRHIEKLWRR